jgi:hypothetical protein
MYRVDYDKLRKRPNEFIALTGLRGKEFDELLPTFAKLYEEQKAEEQNGVERHAGGRTGQLPSMELKLLFVLVYTKTYPLQVVQGAMFEMSQSRANHWIHKLLPVLAQTLDELGYSPERDGELVAKQTTKATAEKPANLIIDGTDRRRARPKNASLQRDHYSGKKKTHTDKNILLVNAESRKIVYLGGTNIGSMHDKTLADAEEIVYPKNTILHKDTGFQGYEPKVLETRQPKKSRAR